MNIPALKWLTEKPFAHRGLHRPEGAVENSLSAFEAAIQGGFGIELDVRRSADDVAVVFHDRNLNRLTAADGPVDQERFEDLAKIPLKGQAETIPSLFQALALVGGRAPVLVELKPEGKIGPLEKSVLMALGDYRGPVAVMSFDPASVAWFAANVSGVTRGLVASCRYNGQYDRPLTRSPIGHFAMRAEAEAQFIAFDIRCLPKYFTRKMRKKGRPVLTWTVRSNEDRARAEKYADNIIFEQTKGA